MVDGVRRNDLLSAWMLCAFDCRLRMARQL
jgi:hypothetical protein